MASAVAVRGYARLHVRCSRTCAGRAAPTSTRRAAVLLLAGCAAPPACAAPNNDLMARVRQQERAGWGAKLDTVDKLKAQAGALTRSLLLAEAGEYNNARQVLRDDPLKTFRTDLEEAKTLIELERPTFDRFEKLAITGALDAYDDALRRVQRGQGEAADVVSNGKLLLEALNEVVGVLDRKAGQLESAIRASEEVPAVVE